MNPTLNQGQIVIGKKIKIKSLKTNQIIAFKFHDKLLIKRIVGSPHDHVKIVDTSVIVNDDIIFSYKSEMKQYYEWTIPENEICVVGDNPRNSLDSRKIGLIHITDIKYSIIARLWPPKLL